MTRTWAMFSHDDANGGRNTTILVGPLHIYILTSKRDSLSWKYHPGRGRLWFGHGTMGWCAAVRPWYIAISHNERPKDRTRRLLRDVARGDQILAGRTQR